MTPEAFKGSWTDKNNKHLSNNLLSHLNSSCSSNTLQSPKYRHLIGKSSKRKRKESLIMAL